jgi:hypothetical protein
MAKSGRRYTRDNRGRFASVGATARGGRLKTAGGNKRQTVTAKAKGGGSGTIAKPKGLKPGTLKPKPVAKPAPAIKAKPKARASMQAKPTPAPRPRTANSREPQLPKSLSGKGVDRGAAVMRFMDRAQGIVGKRQADPMKRYSPLGKKKLARARATSMKAQRYIYNSIASRLA